MIRDHLNAIDIYKVLLSRVIIPVQFYSAKRRLVRTKLYLSNLMTISVSRSDWNFESNRSVRKLWRIQDFPEEGRQLPGGASTYDFAKFYQKLHEIERIWTPGGASLAPP